MMPDPRNDGQPPDRTSINDADLQPDTVPAIAGLSAEHYSRLVAQGISDAVIRERGYQTVTSKAKLRDYGFASDGQQTPTLLHNLYSLKRGREVVAVSHTPDDRFAQLGSPGCRFLPGASVIMDVLPTVQGKVRAAGGTKFITSSVFDADVLVTLGECTMTLVATEEETRRTRPPNVSQAIGWDMALPDHPADNEICHYVVVEGREERERPYQRGLIKSAVAALLARSARVSLVRVPPDADGLVPDLGLYLRTHSLDDLLAGAEHLDVSDAPKSGSCCGPEDGNGDERQECEYRETAGGIVFRDDIRVSSFNARIVRHIAKVDGLTSQGQFEIEVTRGTHVRRFTISDEEFGAMAWVIPRAGPEAVIYPGQERHARCAIQQISREVPRQQVYLNSGWVQWNEQNVYLHGGGAIGAEGLIKEGLQVEMQPGMELILLLEPLLWGPDLSEAVIKSLNTATLTKGFTGPVLLCGHYRVLLGGVDYAQFVVGPTGVLKSALTGVIAAHLGAGFDGRHLMGGWASTDNSLEGLAFYAKDALCVIDDFAPTGSQMEIQKLHARAERLFRSQGNGTGRARMRQDSTLRPTKFPRGMIVASGEDVFRGKSLASRVFVLPLAAGDIDKAKLTQCQRQAADGTFAQVTSTYLQWAAGHYDQIQKALPCRQEILRGLMSQGHFHLRTPDIAASLAAGIELFLQFSVDAGALSEDLADQWWSYFWNNIRAAAEAQNEHQKAADVVERFLALLPSGIAAGKGHLASPHGGKPGNAKAYGWRETRLGMDVGSEPQGTRLGWVEGNDVFLNWEVCYEMCDRLAAAGGEGLGVSPNTLLKRLHERGLLVTTEPTRKTLRIRRMLEDARRPVVHMCVETVLPDGDDQTDQIDPWQGTLQADRGGNVSAPPRNPWGVDAGQTGQIGHPLGDTLTPGVAVAPEDELDIPPPDPEDVDLF